MATIWALLVFLPALLACVAAFGERRAQGLPRWRLLAPPLLVGAATVVLLYLPPSNDIRDPQVWMLALVAGVAGVVRGSAIRLVVDQRRHRVLMRRAPEGFWIAAVVALLVAAEIAADPFGQLGSRFIPTIELAMAMLWSFLLGRNAALLLRSRDVPHHDL